MRHRLLVAAIFVALELDDKCDDAISKARNQISHQNKNDGLCSLFNHIGPKLLAYVFLIKFCTSYNKFHTPALVWLLGGQLQTMPRSTPLRPPDRVPRGLTG